MFDVLRKIDSDTFVVLDIDGTLAAGNREARKAVRAYGDKNGLAFFTARTPELCMSHAVFTATKNAHFRREQPKAKNSRGELELLPLETVDEFENLLDPHLIASFGVGVFYSDGERYVEDGTFIIGWRPHEWRQRTLNLIRAAAEPMTKYLATIEDPKAYEENRADIVPLPFRIQFDFPSLDLKLEAKLRLAEAEAFQLKETQSQTADLCFVDESNPDKSRFTLYVMPSWATKDAALRHMVGRFMTSGVCRSKLFYAGDTLTDILPAFQGGGLPGVSMLVGGSRLSNCFSSGGGDVFAGESLVEFKRAMKQQDRRGFYSVQLDGFPERMLIVADEVPEYRGTVGAESILAYLREIGECT